MAVKSSNKRNAKAREPKRAKTDSFLAIHFKQAKASFSSLWSRPLGNILTLAVISMALAMVLARPSWASRSLKKVSMAGLSGLPWFQRTKRSM